MKALQLFKPRTFFNVDVPQPNLVAAASENILVRTGWISICGSDIPFFNGNKRHQLYPLPAGAHAHECVGQVIECKSDLYQEGDWVVAIPENDLGLAEFFVARASKSVRLPADLADMHDCCLIQPLSTVLNAVDRLGELGGKSVAVVGLGSIGLLFCWLLKKKGAGQIVGIDPIPARCQAAEEFGADQTYAMRSLELVHFARQNPGTWHSPNICIEAVGHQMDTLNDCLDLVQQQGTILAFGVPDQAVYAFEYEKFFRKNAQLVAAVTPDWQDYLARSRDLFLKFREELTQMITHRFAIRDAEKAFQMYAAHAEGILKATIDATQW